MELDNLKKSWFEVNNQTENQPKLTPKKIEQMTQKKYNSNIRKVVYPEVGGALVCLTGAAFIAYNFNKLDTGLLQSTGIASIFLLFTLTVCSLFSLSQFSKTGDLNQSHVEMLKKFALQKLQFLKLQKINVILCYLLLVTVLVLFPKLFNGIDLSNNRYFWIFSFTFGYIFLSIYSKWVMNYYRKTLQETKELLEALVSK